MPVMTQMTKKAAIWPGSRNGTQTKARQAMIIAQHQTRCLPNRRLSASQPGIAATPATK